MKLERTVVLVTGAAKRVGRAIAMELASGGCDVAVHYRESASDAEALADRIRRLGRRAITTRGDLADAATWPMIVDATVRGLGRLDMLVNNASRFLTDPPDTLDAFTPDAWERMQRINVTAAVGLVHHARVHLAAGGAGKVINLADAGVARPWRDHLAYCASKAALANVTASLALALAPAVQVNAVAPGLAAFPESYGDATRARLVDRVPLKRAGTPEEVARLVRFLAEHGDYITGQVIAIDGGRSVA